MDRTNMKIYYLRLSSSVLVFTCIITLSSAKINRSVNNLEEKSDTFSFPKSFAECTDYLQHNKVPKKLVQTVQRHCLDGFISVDHTQDWAVNFTADEQNYISSIFRKVIIDADAIDRVRNKRGASLFPKKLRREVRAAPYQHWEDYKRHVRRLKYEAIKINGRSKYDIIADIHATAIQSAHFGPNFLPWHRLYLIVLEAALGVPIPYWESPIDFEMQDPTQSILWTEKYFGNGFGLVTTGPFKNFQTPMGPLFRNIGSDGSLMERRGVTRILQQSRLSEISDPTAADMASLEGQHNGVHIWVDGQMNNLEVSPHDPVFFLHHCFIDLVWDMFRSLQIKRGIDPTNDTVAPPDDVMLQNFTDPAVGLAGYYNNDGYSKMVASMIKFQPTARCPECSNSADLYCDKRKGVCVSKKRHLSEYAGKKEEAPMYANLGGLMSNGSNSNPFRLYQRDMRVRMDSVTLNYNELSNNGNGQIRDNSVMVTGNVPNTNGVMNGNGRSSNDFGTNGPWQSEPVFRVNGNLAMDQNNNLGVNGPWQSAPASSLNGNLRSDNWYGMDQNIPEGNVVVINMNTQDSNSIEFNRITPAFDRISMPNDHVTPWNNGLGTVNFFLNDGPMRSQGFVPHGSNIGIGDIHVDINFQRNTNGRGLNDLPRNYGMNLGSNPVFGGISQSNWNPY